MVKRTEKDLENKLETLIERIAEIKIELNTLFEERVISTDTTTTTSTQVTTDTRLITPTESNISAPATLSVPT